MVNDDALKKAEEIRAQLIEAISQINQELEKLVNEAQKQEK